MVLRGKACSQFNGRQKCNVFEEMFFFFFLDWNEVVISSQAKIFCKELCFFCQLFFFMHVWHSRIIVESRRGLKRFVIITQVYHASSHLRCNLYPRL